MVACGMIETIPLPIAFTVRPRRKRRYGLGQDSSLLPSLEQALSIGLFPLSGFRTQSASATTYGGALQSELLNPVGAIAQAGSQLYGDVTSSTPVSDTLQNLAGSLSQSQVNDQINSCVQEVKAAGGVDTGQCASLVKAVVKQANATPIGFSLPKVPSGSSSFWAYLALGLVGALMVYEIAS